jgi:anti-sigma B factor antagonist
MSGMELPPEPFEIEESRSDGTTVLTLHGELDLAYADGLSARLDELRDRGEPVILDLDQLEFVDSSGLRVLLKATQDSEDGAWRFQVTRGSEAVVRLLRAAGLEGRLPTVEGPVG